MMHECVLVCVCVPREKSFSAECLSWFNAGYSSCINVARGANYVFECVIRSKLNWWFAVRTSS